MKCKTCGTDHRGVAKHGGYCLAHQEQRAEAAESRIRDLEMIMGIGDAHIKTLTERISALEAELLRKERKGK